MLKLDSDDFELFGLQRRFRLDPAEVDARWRDLQQQVHPDNFASDGPALQRLAMQWSVRVNEARLRLRDPLRRAEYLCELAGVPIQAETNTAMPPGFLVEQMEWREALDAASSAADIHLLAAEVAARAGEAQAQIARQLDDALDPHAAAVLVRSLMFIRRFADDVSHRLELVAAHSVARHVAAGR